MITIIIDDTTAKLVDLNSTVQNILKSVVIPNVSFTVVPAWNRDNISNYQMSVVSFNEWNNLSTKYPTIDRIIFQIDIWAVSREILKKIFSAVNNAMYRQGFTRCHAGPENPESVRFVHKTIRFVCNVDKRAMRAVNI